MAHPLPGQAHIILAEHRDRTVRSGGSANSPGDAGTDVKGREELVAPVH
jgi:hypothetical protein